MSNLPYRCEKCGNYYVVVPSPETEAGCPVCAVGGHATLSHCHFGQESATYSEAEMVKITESIRTGVVLLEKTASETSGLGSIEEVRERLTAAEQAFSQVEREQARVAEVLRWAGIFEMPGMIGEPQARRFKSTEALQELVSQSRRPPEDLAAVRRSTKNCDEMALTVTGLSAQGRVAIGQVRQAAEGWRPKEAEDRMAKARAARAAKREAAKEPVTV